MYNELVLACDFETKNEKEENGEVRGYVVAFSCKEVYRQTRTSNIEIQDIQEINNKVFYFDSTNLDLTVVSKFFDYLFSFKDYQRVNIFFHNLKNFDAFFLIPYLLDNFKPITLDKKELENNEFYTLYVNNFLLNIRLKKDDIIYNFIDSLSFFPQTSLKQLGEIVDLPKLEFDHDFDITVEKPFNSQRYLTYVEYTKRDVEVLAKFLLFFVQKTKINLLNTVSAAGISFKYFEQKYGQCFKKGLYLIDQDQWNIIHQSYYGGFTYLNEKYALNVIKNINYFDINSAYPNILQQPLPYGELELYENQKGGAKLLKIRITKLEVNQHNIATIRSKKYNELFIKNSNQPFYYYIWEFELNYVKQFYKVFEYKVIKTYWMKLKITMKKYIEEWFGVKQKNAAKATSEQKMFNILAKIFLNSLYGKYGEKLIKPQRIYIEKELLNEYIKDNAVEFIHQGILYQINTIHQSKKYKNFVEITITPLNPEIDKIKNIGIASFVTAKVRVELYKQILENIDTFVYCDTDSIILKDNHLKKWHLSDKQLGLWKYEYESVKGYFLKPKQYIIFEPESNKIMFKTAGFQKALLDMNIDFDKIVEQEIEFEKVSSKKSATGVVLVKQKSKLKVKEGKWEKIKEQ